MRKWRVQGWLDGELTGEITAIDSSADERGAGGVAVAGDSGEHDVFEREPRWREFWEDTGEREAALGESGETEALPAAAGRAGVAEASAAADELAGVDARRLWTWAVLVALLGVAARAGWYFMFEDDFTWRLGPSGMEYLGQAVGYMQGALTDPAIGPAAPAWREMLPPGYGLFLAGIFQPFGAQEAFAQADGPMLAVRAVQWLLAGGVTLMTFALARRVLFGWAALAPAVLVTASMALVDLPSLLANETLLAFLLTACVLLLVKAREAEAGRDRVSLVLLAGILFSYMLITQPRLVLLLPLAAIWLGRSTRVRVGVAFAVLALLMPAGWMARNYALFDQVVPVSPTGHASVYTDNVDPVGGSGTDPYATPVECPRSQLLMGPIEQRFGWVSCMRREGFGQVAAHPDQSALAVPDRVAALASPWNPTRARGEYAVPHWDYHYLIPQATLADETFRRVDRTLNYVWVGGYILLVAVGLFVLWAEGPRSSARIIAWTVISLPLVHIVLHAENRFRVPFLPMAMIALTLGAMTAWEALRRDAGRSG